MTSDTVPQPRPASLVAGAGWTYLIFISNRGVTFVSAAILARLLDSGDFGLMAAALLALGYLDSVKDAGIGAALVREAGQIDHVAKVAFSLSIGLGLLLTASLIVASPYLARFFDEPRLQPLLMVLSPTLMLGSLNSVQSYWQQRNFKFRSRVLPESMRSVFKAVFSISLAVFGFGVWSLAIGQLAGEIAAVLGYLKISGLKLRFALERSIAVRLLSVGLPIAIVTLTGVVAKSIDQLVTGKLLSAVSLGYYYIAASISQLIVMSLCTTASSVLYPAFSRTRESQRLLRHSYLASARIITALTFPVAGGLAIVAPDFITIVYSERWLPSVPVLQLLALNALVVSTAFNAGDVFKAVGKSNVLTRISILGMVIAAPLMIYMSRWGIVGIAAAQVAASVLIGVVTVFLICREIKMTIFRFGAAILPATVGTICMALACAAVTSLLASHSPLLRLPVVVATGAVVYAGSGLIFNRKLAQSLWREWKRRGSRRKATGKS